MLIIRVERSHNSYVITGLIITILLYNLYLFFPNGVNNSYNIDYNEELRSSATRIIERQWLKNSDFSTQEAWNYTKGDLGDNSTVEAYINGGYGNLKVIGDTKTFTVVSGTPNNTLTSPDWQICNNSDYLLPDDVQMNASGCYVYHYLDENENGGAGQVHNFPSVHFKKNISIDVNMSDYEIISASLDVIFNASVASNVDAPGDTVGQSAIWDSATFYVEISDLVSSYSSRVGEYKTVTLGQDDPSDLIINNTLIPIVNEADLINALESAFEKDLERSNLTIILGIDVYCEDNDFPDYDLWNALIINACNLTFTCVKKIEQFTSISWNQIGDKIEGADIQIKNATLNFDYMIDNIWPTAASPFSEVRIIINNNRYSETIRLSEAVTILKEAKEGGFDVTPYISKGTNITVSIQVFIANTFGLAQNTTLSIDDVFLTIYLIETFPDIEPSIQLSLNGVNKTLDPFIEVPTGQNLNVTIKYMDESGSHISESLIQLMSTGFVEDFIEDINLQQYTVIINSTEKLILGNNLLAITTQKINYVSKELNPTISVRKINAEFSALNESTTISIKPGKNAVIRVRLNDTDFDRAIIGAVVFYSWNFGQGTLTDSDNDGIYEGTIRNVPEGSFRVTISAYGIEEYNFQDYELTLNAISPTQPDWTWLIILLSGAFGGLVIVFTLYQFHFKYPPMVRKIRKLRKKMKKGKTTKPIIILDRKEIIKSNFESQSRIIEFEPELEKVQINSIKKEIENNN